MSAHDEQVARILADAAITYDPKFVPSGYDAASKEWQGITWAITFTSARGTFTTDFKQGIGHLPEHLRPKFGTITIHFAEFIAAALKTGRDTGNPYKLGRPAVMGKPLAPPTAADVLYCLISDASAADYATFEEWARDTGYESDSRKAEKIFNACRETALNLNRVFGAAVVEQLKVAVQDM